VLALAEGRPVPRSLLTDLLWGSRGREQAQASLRQSVHELRRCLAPLNGTVLVSDRDNLTLRSKNLWVDAVFVATPGLRPAHLADIFQGPLLSDLAGISESFDAWISARRHELSQRIRPDLTAFLSAAADCNTTLQLAEALLRYDPLHEAAWIALASSHMQKGDQDAARDVYFRCIQEMKASAGASSVDMGRILARLSRDLAKTDTALTPELDTATKPLLRRPAGSLSRQTISGRRVGIAVTPIRAIAETSPDLALCMDWQISSALYRFDNLFCSSVEFIGSNDDLPRRIVAEGFDFLLEGCVDCAGMEVQAAFRLRDLRMKGTVFWSQRISHPSNGAFFSDAECVASLAPQIAAAVSKYLAAALESDLGAEDPVGELVLRASVAVQRLDRSALLATNNLLTEAIRRDSRQPALFAWSAYVQTMLLGQGWFADDAPQHRIGELVDRALSLSLESATDFSIAGHVLAFSQNRLEEGLLLQEKALSKNPALPSAWLFSGLAHIYAGDHKEAISRLEHAKLLSPADDKAYLLEVGLGLSHLLAGHTRLAIQSAENAIRLNPNFSSTFKVELAASGYLHPDERSPAHLKHLLLLEPAFSIKKFMSRTPITRLADRQCVSEGLRLAGLPD
jgi:DNA-binding SARP family transcriptional activator